MTPRSKGHGHRRGRLGRLPPASCRDGTIRIRRVRHLYVTNLSTGNTKPLPLPSPSPLRLSKFTHIVVGALTAISMLNCTNVESGIFAWGSDFDVLPIRSFKRGFVSMFMNYCDCSLLFPREIYWCMKFFELSFVARVGCFFSMIECKC